MNRRGACMLVLMTALLSACAPAQPSRATAAIAPVHVVYDLGEGLPQASRALRNIRNHLLADTSVKIVVVAHADGIDFLLQDAVDAGKYPYELLVQPLIEEGVVFHACQNTLDTRSITRDQLLEGVSLVASGAAEIARLQAREGYAYFRP